MYFQNNEIFYQKIVSNVLCILRLAYLHMSQHQMCVRVKNFMSVKFKTNCASVVYLKIIWYVFENKLTWWIVHWWSLNKSENLTLFLHFNNCIYYFEICWLTSFETGFGRHKSEYIQVLNEHCNLLRSAFCTTFEGVIPFLFLRNESSQYNWSLYILKLDANEGSIYLICFNQSNYKDNGTLSGKCLRCLTAKRMSLSILE
jgi:hypothetical protein